VVKEGDWVQHRECPGGVGQVVKIQFGWVHVRWREGGDTVLYERHELARVQPPKLIGVVDERPIRVGDLVRTVAPEFPASGVVDAVCALHDGGHLFRVRYSSLRRGWFARREIEPVVMLQREGQW